MSNDVVYQVVAARRAQWDNLVWQVPILSLTAQAFLFTVALGNDSSNAARYLSGGLSLVISVLSIILMGRHRQAEIADAHWLADYEATNFAMAMPVHGLTFQQDRNATSLNAGLVGNALQRVMVPGFITWVLGLSLFAAAAVAIAIVTAAWPSVLR